LFAFGDVVFDFSSFVLVYFVGGDVCRVGISGVEHYLEIRKLSTEYSLDTKCLYDGLDGGVFMFSFYPTRSVGDDGGVLSKGIE